MKTLLLKVVGTHCLTFEELTTVLAEAEATINSRPLLPMDSTPNDGVSALTPGHFLIGRPMKATPVNVDNTSKESTLTHWNLVRRLARDLWTRWEREYIQHLQERTRWKNTKQNLKPGDVVLLKELHTLHTWAHKGSRHLPCREDLQATYSQAVYARVWRRTPSPSSGEGCLGFQSPFNGVGLTYLELWNYFLYTCMLVHLVTPY